MRYIPLGRNTINENNMFKKISDKIYNHTSSDKAYQGTFVNQELTSLHGGSLEITLTVPLNWFKLV